jgi:hypothetical protein
MFLDLRLSYPEERAESKKAAGFEGRQASGERAMEQRGELSKLEERLFGQGDDDLSAACGEAVWSAPSASPQAARKVIVNTRSHQESR